MSDIHIVQPGECMLTIAALHGFSDWRQIYFHDLNAELRRRCPDPFVLAADEEVVLPPRLPLERRCQTGRRHVFRLPPNEPTWTLRLLLEHEGGDPCAGVAYRLQVEGEARERVGTTSPQGWLEEEQMPLAAIWGQLALWSGPQLDGEPIATWRVAFGGLDPATTASGQAARLVNLGYLDPSHRDDPDRIDEALAAFRRDLSISPDGDAEKTWLSRVHGS